MRRRVLLVAAVAACTLLLLPTAALAKGPSAATIDGSGPGGPGNGPKGPIVLRGDGEMGSGSELGSLAEDAGFFPALFAQTPDPMLKAAPTKLLGPRYTITWTVPEGDGVAAKVRQDLYPYAATGPLTYTRPGQRVFGEGSHGGWYQASDGLRRQLISLGLPNRPAVTGSGGDSTAAPAPAPQTPSPAPAAPAASRASRGGSAAWQWQLPLAGGLVLLVAGTVAVLLRRRPGRPGPAGARTPLT
jgi:hypothetical protein